MDRVGTGLGAVGGDPSGQGRTVGGDPSGQGRNWTWCSRG